MDPLPVDAFLSSYPEAIRDAADQLRDVVRLAVPKVVERVRLGWRLIGYDLPVGGRLRFFAYVAPEPAHVHLGFEYGVWMDDPDRVLQGAHLKLRKVRYVTFLPEDAIPMDSLVELTREAARVAAMSPAERMAVMVDRQWRPGS